jgi:hypothetical protein
MALTKGTNSYVDLAEADIYFQDRLDVAAWDEAPEIEKEKALVTSTTYLNSLEWVGYIEDSLQALAFPRQGYYYDPKYGREVTLDGEIPDRIIIAQMELAYHFLNNDGLLDDTGKVVNLEVASIKLEEIQNAPKIPSFVRNLLKPLLLNSRQWWRAN